MRTFVVCAVALAASVIGCGPADAASANDERRDAMRIEELPFSATVDTRGADDELGDPADDYCSASRSVWYRYTAEGTQDLAIGIEGFRGATLVVWRENEVGVPVVNGGDSCLQSANGNVLAAVDGRTYWLEVGGRDGETGRAAIRLDREGTIAGTVVDEDGKPYGYDGILVLAFEAGNLRASVERSCVDSEFQDRGQYELDGLFAGDYKIRFLYRCEDEAGTGPGEWYDNKAEASCAAIVHVVAGEPKAGIDAEVPRSSTVNEGGSTGTDACARPTATTSGARQRALSRSRAEGSPTRNVSASPTPGLAPSSPRVIRAAAPRRGVGLVAGSIGAVAALGSLFFLIRRRRRSRAPG